MFFLKNTYVFYFSFHKSILKDEVIRFSFFKKEIDIK